LLLLNQFREAFLTQFIPDITHPAPSASVDAIGAIVLLLPLLFAGGFVFGVECKTTGLLLLQVDPIRRFTVLGTMNDVVVWR